MQVHGPSTVIKDLAREVRTYLNHGEPAFAVVNIGDVTVHVHTPAEADALIAAAAEAKRLLDPPVPACPAVAPHTGRACTETGEHDCHRAGMVTWTDAEPAPAAAQGTELAEVPA